MNRNESIQKIGEPKEWDIIIIGGGATGLGAAVDAATRGYKTLLLEAHDFGKGTSSRSTKLVHGGVRYLAQGNIKLVMEALHERGRLLRNAPHVAAACRFIVPTYSWRGKWYYWMGLKMYDILSGTLSLGKTKMLSKKKTLEALPGLSSRKLTGGIVYYDGQFDDARLAVDLACTASQHGAVLANYFRVKNLLKEKNKVCGIVAEDVLTKKNYELKGKAVINATGVFADDLMQMDETQHEKIIWPSQGIHIVVEKKFFPGSNALMIPKTDDGRVLFAVPWHNKVVLGTTDTPLLTIDEEPKPLEEEIEFVLHHANRYLNTSITKDNVSSTFAGLRPLVKQKGKGTTSLLSRDHTIIVSKSGLVSITGGKWTTYRRMAEDVVNNAAFVAKLPKKECVTKNLAIANNESAFEKDEKDFLHSSFHYTVKDIERFITTEMAETVEDILARRTRLLFLDAEAAIAAAPAVATTMAAIMMKDDAWIQQQLKAFNAVAKNYSLH
ncbi:MAG TPA: glycerol-3-phosphate dehydrogenase/oxidase [Chitinophagaceae bacterium]|nr:glycerol-3-phosphate dehydrogenase/oxidase [Chitinophagaceae bacterium]